MNALVVKKRINELLVDAIEEDEAVPAEGYVAIRRRMQHVEKECVLNRRSLGDGICPIGKPFFRFGEVSCRIGEEAQRRPACKRMRVKLFERCFVLERNCGNGDNQDSGNGGKQHARAQ